MKKRWKFLIGGVGFFVVLGGGLWVVTRPYVNLAKDQRAALARGDSQAAYDMLSLNARDQITEAEFVEIMDNAGIWEDEGSYSFRSVQIENGVGRLQGTYTSEEGAVLPIAFVVVKEQGELRILGISYGQ